MWNKPKEQYRHELKYRISEREKDLLLHRLPGILRPDPHAGEGGYSIRSLYFDDLWNSASEDKEAGILMRKKYRIRIYNGGDRVIRFERTNKFGEYIYKESAPLSREEFYRILSGDCAFLLHSEHSLLQEFYVEYRSVCLRPRVIVDYERVPLIADAGTVRVTFDSHVRAAVGSFDIFDKTLSSVPAMEPGELLMEVKYTEFLPRAIQDLIGGEARERTAFSKYVLCFEATQYQRSL